MNKQIRKLAGVIILCYLALFVQLNRIQVFQADELNARPENSRSVERDFNRARGSILSAEGDELAFSEEVDATLRYQRTYPTNELFAHVVGSYSFTFGSEGVERSYNDELSGQTVKQKFKGLSNPFVDNDNTGDVKLSLRTDVQQVAKDALGEREGSVVAIDPQTGELLALWSFPSYDPNLVSNNDQASARAFREAFNEDPEKPMLARTFEDRYAPGSTFKVVTTAAGLESGKVSETMPLYPQLTEYTPPATSNPISNFDGAQCGGVIFDALRVSCNTVYAEMGAETLGPEPLISTAEDFGFNSTPPFDIPGAVGSVFPTDFGDRIRSGDDDGDADVYENSAGLAFAAIGQGDVAATPLQMALVAAGISNGGAIMEPHVMSQVLDDTGGVLFDYQTSVWQQPIDAETAETLRLAMVGVVTDGTAKRMAIEGKEVGGKTGTAQVGSTGRSHAWIIGFAGDEGEPAEVAVAVIVEGQPGASEQTGGTVAAPIAKAVLEAALEPLRQGGR